MIGAMDDDERRAIVRRAFEAWTDGTAPITDAFAPDMAWRIEGRCVVAGEYVGTPAFVDAVLAPFGARFTSGERFRPVRVRSVLVDGPTVTVVWDGRGVANDGVPYENSYAWVLVLGDDGLVVDGTAFYDSIAFDELWARVPG
jgi:ketosteroid isomerase-like protein